MKASTVDDVLRDAAWPLTIKALDGKTAFLARLIVQPTPLVAQAVNLIRDKESKDVPAVIDALNSIVSP